MRCAILIPVNRDTARLYETVQRCRIAMPDVTICVVDDGSPEPVAAERLGEPAMLIRFDVNRGKGAALRAGLNRLVENGFDCAVMLDADGQHPPELIPRFIDEYEKSGADLVIGYRLHNVSAMPLDRRFSNFASTKLLELLTKRRLYDVQCGFRLIALARWRELDCDANRFEFEPQMILQAAWRGWRFAYLPVPAIYSKVASSIRRFPDTIRFLRMVVWELRKRNRFLQRDRTA